MAIIVDRTESGVRWVFNRINSPVAYCALTINAGTRDEPVNQNGIAHMTEHMLFKGTDKRGARRVTNFLDRLGGELNAYTTKEETVIHATLLKEDLSKALELLADIAFNSIFPTKELQKERDVILDEIALYKDSPSEQIYDDFERELFGNHPLSKPILGDRESLNSIEREDIEAFNKLYYVAPNITLSISADIEAKRVKSSIERYFKLAPAATNLPDRERVEVEPKRGEMRVKRNNHQSYAVVGTTAYHLYHPNRVPLILLTNIIGGPALNSKLNQLLRERHGLVYSVEATYTPYSDNGLFSIYIGSDRSNIERSLSLIDKELASIRERGLSENAIKSAKKQLIGQLSISADNAEVLTLANGKSLLSHNRVDSLEEVKEKVMAIDSEQLKEIANHLLHREKMFTLIYE